MDRLDAAEAQRLRAVFPGRIVQAIRSTGLSRQSLAGLVGVHINTIHAYASGGRFPRLEQLTLLARALDVSLDWLLDRDGSASLGRLQHQDQEILEYVALENRRGCSPTYVNISHAFDQDPYWSAPHVRKLVRFGLLAQQGGFRLTRAGGREIHSDRPRAIRRTPLKP